MEIDHNLIISRLLFALLAGGVIGMERALHGREAGFRTHTLVCVSSSLLMVLMVYQWQLVPQQFLDTVRADPTRMAQGIMTGIGFLGAGVIIKEGLTVRGLTTAASIWMTASIGIVIGLGFYFAAFFGVVITLITLSVFRWVEGRLPVQIYARLMVRFIRAKEHPDEDALREMIKQYDIRAFEASYQLSDEGRCFEYAMTMRTRDRTNYRRLAQRLMDLDEIYEFRIEPSSS
jgi:putative Mg2+ transporter-C (MgtC) family protein